MSTKNVLSENEAVALAGVSARTLLRFSESGYLTVETDSSGIRWFSRIQLEEIFGVVATSTDSQQPTCDTPSNDTAVSGERPNADVEAASDNQYVSEAISEPLSESISDPTPELALETGTLVDQEESAQALQSQRNLQLEIQRLQNLLSIQERILDSKDDEISDLKSQRSWLRERIEKLEEKSDRDQILLLSETQTIRRLISIQETRKSPVKHLLEWMGLSRTTDGTSLSSASDLTQGNTAGAGSRTIEVRTAANSR